IVSNSWKLISYNENEFIKELSIYYQADKLTTIGNIFNISQGALLGVKNIFKITFNEFELLKESERKLFRPIITCNSTKSGRLVITEYCWFPYNKDGIIFQTEEELNDIEFYQNALLPNKEILSKRKGISQWWGLTRPRNWQFSKKPRLYSNRFGNSNSFVFDQVGNCIIEEGNAFLPKKDFNTKDFYFYLACFSSNIFDKLLSIYSKQLAGGKWYDLGNKNIKNIPIPNINNDHLKNSDVYLKMFELGKELESGNSFVKPVIDDILKSYFYPYR
ncbi:MAG: hypothetical protein KDC52_15030, partial [Ignavibacteriae bacterium]|nr:hypothetical protein [Ignavibacteriota bacterium]